MARKLASIQTIIDIFPHNNADTLEIAKVLGWTCVVLKGQFKKDDPIVFIEPDAILPPGQPAWEFMKDRGYRIKTIKLRGVISQGLIFPLTILPPTSIGDMATPLRYGYKEGDDVTEVLGITKYEPYIPAQLSGEVKGNFPEFLHKTDEMRIQSVPMLLDKHQNKKFYVTEKLDGSSMTVYLNNGEFGVCSRNIDLRETEGNSYWKVARELKLEENMRFAPFRSDYCFPINFSLQGELVGQGVQNNKYKMSNLNFFVFNIFDIDKGQYLCYTDFIIVAKRLYLQTVPILTDSFILSETVEEMIEYSKGKSVLNKDTHREGIVLRPLIEEYEDDLYSRLSFKVINPDFLLKYDSE